MYQAAVPFSFQPHTCIASHSSITCSRASVRGAQLNPMEKSRAVGARYLPKNAPQSALSYFQPAEEALPATANLTLPSFFVFFCASETKWKQARRRRSFAISRWGKKQQQEGVGSAASLTLCKAAFAQTLSHFL